MLTVENIDVFYGDAQALDGVSLEIEEGAIVAIVGANGAGKTSLIRTVAGMLSPAHGRIRYHGTDITGWPSYKVCDLGIGQVAEGRQVFPSLSVAENLAMGAMLPRARNLREQNFEKVYAMFPVLMERRHQAAGTLSGGAADARHLPIDGRPRDGPLTNHRSSAPAVIKRTAVRATSTAITTCVLWSKMSRFRSLASHA
jgi:ABC-type branched-subunit amino acid transport system ATPase component